MAGANRDGLGEAADRLDAEHEGRQRLGPVTGCISATASTAVITGPLGCTIASAWVSSNELMEHESVLMKAAVRASVR
jgi:hypothetical protein